MVLDVAIFKYTDLNQNSFSKYKALNKCYFNIRSSKDIYTERNIYTTDRITYRSLIRNSAQGRTEILIDAPKKLEYFLQLLFRKERFRKGICRWKNNLPALF